MSGNEIRQKFLNFFKERGHKIVPSSSLLPDDPSVLLTTAGMQQFKPYYTGAADPIKDFGCRQTASAQKSFRTSDIDEIGDESHLTFFEMLGNFSFGGYDKEQAIKLAYEFIVKEMGLKIDYATVFGGSPLRGGAPPLSGDNESRAIWKRHGITDVRECGREDNFWGPTGEEGPCGPTTEIYINGIEIWNIVFNQYYQTRDKKLEPLKAFGIDTGMSLERLTMAAQGAPTIFDTDLLKPLMEIMAPHAKIRDILAKKRDVSDFSERKIETSLRIIADHIRGAVFLMADGIRPSNVEQGYILRRVIRRAIRHSSLIKLSDNILVHLIGKVVDMYGVAYPELTRERDNILNAYEQEAKKFGITIERGMSQMDKMTGHITGEQAFHLYDTYGFPLELTCEIAKERGLTVDEAGFNKAFAVHQEKSRAGAVQKFGGHGLVHDSGEIKAANDEEVKIVTHLHTATHLLHQALRIVLGLHVRQMGSDITAERLRFDFTHGQKMSPQEIRTVEDLVNKKIQENLTVLCEEMPYETAIAQGALAFFKEKYPLQVKVYSIGDYSKEICGGPHIQHTGEIGIFKIKKEESSAAGIRRIRAVVV